MQYAFKTSPKSPSTSLAQRLLVDVNNLTPPLASSEGFSYDASVNQSLLPGRTWTLEVTRRF